MALVVLLVLAMIGGTLLTIWDVRQNPPPGQMVDVGGYRLHIYCLGQGSPTVILDAGAGGTSMDWSWVQPRLAQTTRVCAYDRAGAAWSEAGPPPRDAGHMAAELATLLTNASIPGPYVLVGASFGGHVQRLYAASQPQSAVGLVLVDARPEGWDTRLPEIRQAGEEQMGLLRAIAWLSRLGLMRVLLPLVGAPPFVQKFPPEAQSTFMAVGFQARSYDTIVALSEAAGRSDEQVRAAPPLRPMPIIVIRHGIPDADLFGGLPIERYAEAEATWQALQADLAQRLNGELVVADRAGHAIMLEQPDVVSQAIERVVQQTRR